MPFGSSFSSDAFAGLQALPQGVAGPGRRRSLLLGASALGLAACLLGGCAAKKQLKADPKPGGSEVQGASPSAPKARAGARYVVKKGDSLWGIAARPSVLGDPFKWPLLYKQNRDQVVDPDIIDVRQDLKFRRLGDYGKDEVKDAVKKAKETPPYEPHEQPRKVLPVAY